MVSFQCRERILLTVLLLAVMMTQAASSVCGVQCVSHAMPGDHVPAMAHCQSMPKAQTQAANLEGCGASRSFCSVDLSADVQAKAIILASSPIEHQDWLLLPVAASSPQPPTLTRARFGGSPPMTSLRI